MININQKNLYKLAMKIAHLPKNLNNDQLRITRK